MAGKPIDGPTARKELECLTGAAIVLLATMHGVSKSLESREGNTNAEQMAAEHRDAMVQFTQKFRALLTDYAGPIWEWLPAKVTGACKKAGICADG